MVPVAWFPSGTALLSCDKCALSSVISRYPSWYHLRYCTDIKLQQQPSKVAARRGSVWIVDPCGWFMEVMLIMHSIFGHCGSNVQTCLYMASYVKSRRLGSHDLQNCQCDLSLPSLVLSINRMGYSGRRIVNVTEWYIRSWCRWSGLPVEQCYDMALGVHCHKSTLILKWPCMLLGRKTSTNKNYAQHIAPQPH